MLIGMLHRNYYTTHTYIEMSTTGPLVTVSTC